MKKFKISIKENCTDSNSKEFVFLIECIDLDSAEVMAKTLSKTILKRSVNYSITEIQNERT